MKTATKTQIRTWYVRVEAIGQPYQYSLEEHTWELEPEDTLEAILTGLEQKYAAQHVRVRFIVYSV